MNWSQENCLMNNCRLTRERREGDLEGAFVCPYPGHRPVFYVCGMWTYRFCSLSVMRRGFLFRIVILCP